MVRFPIAGVIGLSVYIDNFIRIALLIETDSAYPYSRLVEAVERIEADRITGRVSRWKRPRSSLSMTYESQFELIFGKALRACEI